MPRDLLLARARRGEIRHVRGASHHHDVEHAERKRERVRLRDIGDSLRDLAVAVRGAFFPVKEDAPRGMQLAHKAFQQGALARAVPAEDAVDARAAERERDVLEDRARRVIAEM